MNVLDKTALLPEPFLRWFASRGWAPRAHQLELLAKARASRCVPLIAPTGAGKTLAGFLPSLVELSAPVRAPNSSRPGASASPAAGTKPPPLHIEHRSPQSALLGGGTPPSPCRRLGRTVRNCARLRSSSLLPLAEAGRNGTRLPRLGARRRTARCHQARDRLAAALGRAFHPPRARLDLPAGPAAKNHAGLCQYA